MLTLSNVDYYYHNELFHFDASISPHSIVALMGPSGAGKSTLLALVAGFIEPTEGTIEVEGSNIVGKEPHQRPFAMLFQEHNLFAHLTVRQNIGLGLHPGLKLTSEQQTLVEQASQQVGVEAYLDRLPEQLSGGQRQRVALARCFVQPHKIWLLDEPFSALDPILREEMLNLVSKLAKERNITVVMVTHHISDAKAIASDFIFVANGRVEVSDNIEQLSSSHANQALSDFVRAGE
ncbi:thiamine ABC transporter ATP-binding protein [Vibrio tubiashii]|uniref:thiamine ABC transporter ATP-binding protein n=1 Tax=Vibrio tubiashii TaxID=29498 RepID=UPI001EFE5B6F|nr:thiamine ABC transporter ATP-binding protein [Vibrio tubiashii]MCG9584430.1 thiamine ABC transporter ATP-binding protein [Vibrio tubiashii]MCG9617958.1 thiamine ABC transporter ATP-binding protein [Vibrio tubiashii]MCG9686757.1 thiamine ABC transporter ATP-binding protein [Vibrio tubiashii]